jgi:hypothetical protein
VSGTTQAARAERKALLATRAELDRHRVMLAVHEVKAIVSPSSVADRAESVRPLASTLLTFLGPFAGARRLSRWMRYGSFGLMALRLVRDWRGGPR